MTETKTQRKERLRKMREKYGLGEYQNKRKVFKQAKSIKTMARKRSRSRSRVSSSSVKSDITGVLGYAVWSAVVAPRLPLSGSTLSIGELAAGYMLKSKGGIVGSTAKTAYVINLYKLTMSLASPILSSMSGMTTTSGGSAYLTTI